MLAPMATPPTTASVGLISAAPSVSSTPRPTFQRSMDASSLGSVAVSASPALIFLGVLLLILPRDPNHGLDAGADSSQEKENREPWARMEMPVDSRSDPVSAAHCDDHFDA